jgi:hypothetical protein
LPCPPEPPRLHLLGGRWIASCPSCGIELAAGRDQEDVERCAALHGVQRLPIGRRRMIGGPVEETIHCLVDPQTSILTAEA